MAGSGDLRWRHRLDRQTSGLLVFARDPTTAAGLARQFAGHRVDREYRAIAAGRFGSKAGTPSGSLTGSIETPVAGKRAMTRYTILAAADDATLLAIRLGTGRRNQIRVHFADRGHPLLGEARYDPDAACHDRWPYPRLALHAGVLGFLHPVSRQPLRFVSPLPREFGAFRPEWGDWAAFPASTLAVGGMPSSATGTALSLSAAPAPDEPAAAP